MRTTGNGAAVFVFSLPSFVVDSIAQQIQSEHHLINNYKMLSPNAEFPYSQHFVEQLYNLPAQWGVNNDFDDLVICLGIMISELEQDPKIRSISWQTAKNITKSELSTTRLKSSFFKLAEKKGAKKKWNSLILQSEQGMSVTFDDEGIKIE